MASFVVPVYNNRASLPQVLWRLDALQHALSIDIEAIFVVDGSPDGSHAFLSSQLHSVNFKSELIALSRNFGSFSAISTGLSIATGDFVAIMSADLQEPESLYLESFFCLLTEDIDIVIATRTYRNESSWVKLWSSLFWKSYRAVIQPEMPVGGFDVFVAKRKVANALAELSESHTTLVGLLLWLGFRRREVPYVRQEREHGRSSWTARKKIEYAMDSMYAFSKLPVQIITFLGAASTAVTLPATVSVWIAHATNQINVQGYTPLMLVLLSISSVLVLSLGVIANYIWRIYENTKFRPNSVISGRLSFSGLSRPI